MIIEHEMAILAAGGRKSGEKSVSRHCTTRKNESPIPSICITIEVHANSI